ncbi:MAG: hypothetical protein ACLP2X_24900, partial [Syntrophobacteraceae bacterium]
ETTTKTGGGKRNRRDDAHAKRLVHDMDILSFGLSYLLLAPSLQGIDSRIVNGQATPNGYLEIASIGGWIVRCIGNGGENSGDTSQIYFSSENSRK